MISQEHTAGKKNTALPAPHGRPFVEAASHIYEAARRNISAQARSLQNVSGPAAVYSDGSGVCTALTAFSDSRPRRVLSKGMSKKRDLAGFPERVSAGTKRPDAYYERLSGRYAVHRGDEKQTAAGAEAVFEQEGIAVFRGEPGESPAPDAPLTPVYKLHPDGPVAVPTGKIFLRFREDVDASTRREEIERAGYEIIQTPPYAPSSAWVQSASGDPARSLSDVGALEKLPDVENVEPQMLVTRSFR